jgi:putative addiction module component (TIGR02574 family)
MALAIKTEKKLRRRLKDQVRRCNMSASLKQIEEQARALSAEERAKLAESMLESLHSPVSEVESAWAEEIERRVAAFDRGEIPSYPAEDVFAEARRLSR